MSNNSSGKKLNIKKIESRPNIFKVNEYITLKLEDRKTSIYIQGKKFRQCMGLFLDISRDDFQEYDEINSIDEAAEIHKNILWENNAQDHTITPEQEFWGHCSNLKTWEENQYDSGLLHSSLAFPLLKKLADIGDLKALKIFKEEIVRRLENNCINGIKYLIREGYQNYLTNEEIQSLDEATIRLIQNISTENIKVLTILKRKTQGILKQGYLDPSIYRYIDYFINDKIHLLYEDPPKLEDFDQCIKFIKNLEVNYYYMEAIQTLERMLEVYPSNLIIFLKLGDLYYKTRARNKSLRAYLKALNLDSNNVRVLAQICKIFLEWGLRKCMLKMCRRINEINSECLNIFLKELRVLYYF